MNILGIESSCDETAAAVVADGRRILSSVVASQIEVHHRYGGVVPELASRAHIEAMVPVVREALRHSGIAAENIQGVAVTQGPGLVGCLLVGFCFAKAFAYARGLPWVGVDHLAGHLSSVLLSDDPPDFPYVALLASGGHTGVYYVQSPLQAELLGQTRDDAAGEAYDKVAKMLGLGYPGGAVIDQLASRGNADSIAFTRPYLEKDRFDFSFSGLKTAVHRYLQTHPDAIQTQQADVAAAFQAAVVDVLIHKLLHAAAIKKCSKAAVVGGVAANTGLRRRLHADAARRGIQVYIPDISLCGDNAAMIAATGFHLLKSGSTSTIDTDVYSRNTRPETLRTRV
ncbi:MAG: tRNA (adenosine(37)-N6)-threonylcarbamoyltransferase complex transferase subunit TsaD [Desulfatitalea sp.]|nr:tRNA (adenosine(37)-N6)-threonylcarbamoyltransferase complex transferase subunit TsaD [Desulfatitalea sp.]NNK00398.1 tRNA (adenosine(37)-N6)-threonylcarbamoyltransferase complex transferase subunit TsaD [Desulfatitalea sp.]